MLQYIIRDWPPEEMLALTHFCIIPFTLTPQLNNSHHQHTQYLSSILPK